jgi:hypothetical protein
MKSKTFQKSQNKANICQKSQNWPKKGKFAKKKAKLSKIWLFVKFLLFWKILAFLENFVFFGTSLLFCHFGV